MKKLYGMGLLLLLTVVLFGCASQPAAAPAQADAAQGPDVPDWFINDPDYGDVISGVGVAKMSDASKTKTAAEGRARVALARTISAKVRASLIDLQKEGGLDGSTATTNFFEDIARTLSEADMSGATVKNRYVAKDGTMYVLMTFSAADAAKLVEQQANATARKNAAYAQVQANISLANMDKAFAEAEARVEKVTSDF